jgi:hypothetical protein
VTDADTEPAPPPDDEKTVPKSQHRMAAEAAFDGIPLGTAEYERSVATNWCETAALHLSNEEYWRERARKAEAEVLELEERLSKLSDHFRTEPIR